MFYGSANIFSNVPHAWQTLSHVEKLQGRIRNLITRFDLHKKKKKMPGSVTLCLNFAAVFSVTILTVRISRETLVFGIPYSVLLSCRTLFPSTIPWNPVTAPVNVPWRSWKAFMTAGLITLDSSKKLPQIWLKCVHVLQHQVHDCSWRDYRGSLCVPTLVYFGGSQAPA